MKKIFVFGSTPALAGEMVAFAHSLNAECTAIVCGCEDAGEYAACGAEHIAYFGTGMQEAYAKPVAEYLKSQGAELFAAAMNATGRELAAKVAGYCDCGLVSDMTGIRAGDDGLTAERMLFGGAVIQSYGLDGMTVVTVPTGKYKPAAGTVADVCTVNCEADHRVSITGSAPILREGVDLTAADKVVGAGMGFTTREELNMAYELAKALGAEVGCSRSLAEDQHWFDEYIGLSGVQISPKLYFALGISGQIQHTVGVRGSQVIAAINKDEKCPMFANCDYGVVGDMYRLVPMLIEELKK